MRSLAEPVTSRAADSGRQLKRRREPCVHRRPGNNIPTADSDMRDLAASKCSVDPIAPYAKYPSEFSGLVASRETLFLSEPTAPCRLGSGISPVESARRD
jgi:hypothetical protein